MNAATVSINVAKGGEVEHDVCGTYLLLGNMKYSCECMVSVQKVEDGAVGAHHLFRFYSV